MHHAILRSVLTTAILASICLAQDYKLVTPNPTKETQALANYLKSVYGKKIISGQMDEQHLDRIISASGGKEPALMGYDFYGLKPGTQHSDPAKAIRWVKEKGGIAQFTWHWDYPGGGGGFYDLNFDLVKALSDTSQGIGKALVQDIHAAAGEIKRMKDAGVPILWRPVHEAEGGWFWWGAKGGDACKQLYRLWFDILVKQHGLNNIIWVWTSYAGGNKGNWFPGNDVVDMIVYDYPDAGIYQKFKDLFGTEKMFGIGEVGTLPDPAKFSNEPYLYFMCWDYMILKPGEKDSQGREGKNDLSWIYKVYNDPKTITLSDMPDYLNPSSSSSSVGSSSSSAIPGSCTVELLCESEFAEHGNLTVQTTPAGFSGTGVVGGFTDLDVAERLTFRVYAPTAGEYALQIRAASVYGVKSYVLDVNGGIETKEFPFTGNAYQVKAHGVVYLQAGSNTLSIYQGNGYYLIDWIQLNALAPTANLHRSLNQQKPQQSPVRSWNLLGQKRKTQF